jgi:hypothetical protein
MPGLAGAAVIRRVARTSPQSSCVVYSGFGDGAPPERGARRGRRGYVLKDAPLDALVRALGTDLGVSTRTQAVASALRHELISEVRLTPGHRRGSSNVSVVTARIPRRGDA